MDDKSYENLPDVVSAYIESVVKKMRYKKKVRVEVREELAGHFADALHGCGDENKEQVAKELIEGFGDAKMLAILIRRGKKRNRPLWKKAIIKTLQVIGILILFVLLRGGYMSLGKPTITVDYSQWLTEKVSGDKDESLNAATDIIKAMELLDDQYYGEMRDIEADWPGDMSDEERELIKNDIEANEAAIEKLKVALEKPYYWANYEVEPDNIEAGDSYAFTQAIIGTVMPPLSNYKDLVRGIKRRALLRAHQGDVDGAISDCLILQEFGNRQIGKGLLIEQLVGFAIEAMGHSAFYEVIDRVALSAEQLEYVQRQLEKNFAGNECRIDLDAERVFFYDITQHMFTDDGEGSGRVLLKAIPFVANDWKDGIKILLGVSVPDRREFLREVDSYFDNADNQCRKTPWQIKNAPGDIGWGDIESDAAMVRFLGSGHEKVSELSWRLQTERDGLIATVALLRYEKEMGELPGSLEALVEAGYIKQIPLDPYSDGALVYKRTDDGFTLYSVGKNFVDDGGEYGEYRNTWNDDGDAVFWPVR